MLKNIDPEKFQIFIEINALINSNYAESDILLDRILDSATVLTQGESSSILLVDDNNESLYFKIAKGPKSQDIKEYSVALGEGIAGWVALHQKSLIVNDTDKEKRYLATLGKKIGYKSSSILAVPLTVKGKCLGVIEIINKEDTGHFSEEDLEWLEIFSTQAALAMQNAQNYQKLKKSIPGKIQEIAPEREKAFLFRSQPMIQTKKLADRMAKSESAILILGESGTGKEVLASYIHHQSNRKKSAFIPINCAAIPSGLLENELFGHEKGAFTDAAEKRIGYLGSADGGTLFLDEIAEIPLEVQGKLLRVLQEKAYQPVGSSRLIKTDIRILAATNKNLRKMVGEGAFRKDLFYRLNVLEITLPPLRERKDDIILLAEYFLTLYTAPGKKESFKLSEESKKRLVEYNWPGNIRELQNIMERAAVTSKEPVIRAADLHLESHDMKEEEFLPKNLKGALQTFKRDFIQRSLIDHQWNQTRTAEALDIQRTYLSKLIKEFDIIKE